MIATVGSRIPVRVIVLFMLTLAFRCQRVGGFTTNAFRFASKVAKAKVASTKTAIRSSTDTIAGVDTVSADTGKATDNVDGSQPAYFGRKYSMAHKTLPDETMYIFDGTAMLFQAYFAGGAMKNGIDKAATNGKPGKPAMQDEVDGSGEVEAAVLSPELNRKIIASMTDEQIRAMIACLQDRDNTAANPVTGEVAFDAGRTTFRNGLYPQYKQQRTQVSNALF
jgi:hypothetical protein